MKVYVVLSTDKLNCDDMRYVGCSLTHKGALNIVKHEFDKYYTDSEYTDTETDEYYRTSKHPYEGVLVCIRTEEVN